MLPEDRVPVSPLFVCSPPVPSCCRPRTCGDETVGPGPPAAAELVALHSGCVWDVRRVACPVVLLRPPGSSGVCLFVCRCRVMLLRVAHDLLMTGRGGGGANVKVASYAAGMRSHRMIVECVPSRAKMASSRKRGQYVAQVTFPVATLLLVRSIGARRL